MQSLTDKYASQFLGESTHDIQTRENAPEPIVEDNRQPIKENKEQENVAPRSSAGKSRESAFEKLFSGVFTEMDDYGSGDVEMEYDDDVDAGEQVSVSRADLESIRDIVEGLLGGGYEMDDDAELEESNLWADNGAGKQMINRDYGGKATDTKETDLVSKDGSFNKASTRVQSKDGGKGKVGRKMIDGDYNGDAKDGKDTDLVDPKTGNFRKEKAKVKANKNRANEDLF